MDRLKLLLISDRTDCSAEMLEMIKNDIIQVITKYMEIDTEGIPSKAWISRLHAPFPRRITEACPRCMRIFRLSVSSTSRNTSKQKTASCNLAALTI